MVSNDLRKAVNLYSSYFRAEDSKNHVSLPELSCDEAKKFMHSMNAGGLFISHHGICLGCFDRKADHIQSRSKSRMFSVTT